MNFYVLLAIVYLFGEYVEGFTPYFILPSDSTKKLEKIRRTYDELQNQLAHRDATEYLADTKAIQQKVNFKSFTGTDFTDIKPNQGWWAKILWSKAKKASDRYLKIKNRYEDEKFCHPNMSNSICSRVFKNSYFKDENLTYDSNSMAENGAECVSVSYLIGTGGGLIETYAMKYKTCSATRENADGTKSSVAVYLQSAYKQPLLRKRKYFVMFKYTQNPETKEWKRSSDPKSEGKYRYEAYLSLH